MAKKQPPLLTQANYARSRKARGLSGGSREAVRKAVDEGRITAFGPDKLIDQELADVQWARNTRVRAATEGPAPAPSASQAPAAAPAPGGDLVDLAGAELPAPPPGAAAAPDVPTSLQSDPTYQDARARQAVADARTAELKLAELEGTLVRIDQVRAALAGKLAPVREALLQIPARLAPLLAPQSDAGRIQTQLEAEIHQVLATLSNGAMLAPEGTGG